MILVTGATGQFGKTTIHALLNKNVPAGSISALVRDLTKATDLKEKGIHLKTGDYDDATSLLSALRGVNKLLLVSGNDIPNRARQQRNVVEAAVAAGVTHIVYTSFLRRNETAGSPIAAVAASHIETERIIKESGIPYTIMRNSLYADILPGFMGEKVLETGIYLPAGNGSASFALRQDMAEAAAEILTGSGHENKDYIIANERNYTMHDVAAMLSELSGAEIPYTSPTTATYTDTLSKAGVPEEYIQLIAGFSEAIEQGEFETSHSDLRKLLGRTPTDIKEYLKSVYFSTN
ncbi:MAG: SDR family oxidoreductase [Sphingobacteriia bacterium]|nr:SDR family oxidoreductase [Sphingobacteriia bacterium]